MKACPYFKMNPSTSKRPAFISLLACIALAISLFPSMLHSATITLTAGDGYNVSSFNTGTNWSDTTAPSSSNDYSVSALTLRTPITAGNYTFGGSSLTLKSAAVLAYKGISASDVITINNFYMQSGTIQNWQTNTFTLAGSMTLVSGTTNIFGPSSVNAGFTVTSTIGGAGTLSFTDNSLTTIASTITLSGNNTFSGGTLLGKYSNVIGTSTGAFGAGNVKINGDGGKLVFQNSAAMENSGNLIIATGLTTYSITLDYAGTMFLSGISINGGSSYLSSGIYSITDLNNFYGYNIFSGAGSIQIIPEPSATVLFALGIFGTLALWSKKTRRLS